jgi:hypothetical protein
MVRLAIRTSAALFTAVVVILIASAFLSSTVSIWMTIIVTGVMLVSYFRPHNGLLLIAALAPLGAAWSPLMAPRVRGAETLVLAFLAGALLNGWTLHRFTQVRVNRMSLAALSFGVVVASSCVGELWTSGATLSGILDYSIRQYVATFRGFGAIYAAMLLVEGVALLFFTAHAVREQRDFGARLSRMIVISGVAAAAVNLLFFAGELMETGEPAARLTDFFLRRRWSAHIGDVNAAGSYFAMIACIALGLSVLDRAWRLAWLGAGALTGLALWMTASRTAFMAVLLVSAAGLLWVGAMRSVAKVRRISVIAVAAMVVVSLGGLYSLSDVRGATPSKAVNIRWMFLETTWRMLEAHPLAGVGIGQYGRWSAVFSSPELKALYPRENAHNNFAQIAGELGLAGFVPFVVMLAFALRPEGPRPAARSVTGSATAGLAVFIVSWLGGHPLLVAEVAYPFWLTLGVVAGFSAVPPEAGSGLATDAREAREGST